MASYQRALALCLALLLAGGAAAQQPRCPLTASAVNRLDYRPAAAACKAGAPNFCEACVCGLAQVFAPAILATGFSPSGLTQQAATELLTSCLSIVLPPLTRAGIQLGALMSLQNCPSEPVPQCLAQYLPADAPAASVGGGR
jgi:hypothetical protein